MPFWFLPRRFRSHRWRSRMIEEYRNHCRQPSQRNPETTVKGATVNREIQCLHCMFQFTITRKYITESPAGGVKHFDERRERPVKRMLTVEEEQRILEVAPPHLRVAIILPVYFRVVVIWAQSPEATLIGSGECRQLRSAWSYSGHVTSSSSK
jgi:hypothetical protein